MACKTFKARCRYSSIFHSVLQYAPILKTYTVCSKESALLFTNHLVGHRKSFKQFKSNKNSLSCAICQLNSVTLNFSLRRGGGRGFFVSLSLCSSTVHSTFAISKDSSIRKTIYCVFLLLLLFFFKL